jgi:hypothetical protein
MKYGSLLHAKNTALAELSKPSTAEETATSLKRMIEGYDQDLQDIEKRYPAGKGPAPMPLRKGGDETLSPEDADKLPGIPAGGPPASTAGNTLKWNEEKGDFE